MKIGFRDDAFGDYERMLLLILQTPILEPQSARGVYTTICRNWDMRKERCRHGAGDRAKFPQVQTALGCDHAILHSSWI